jgi:hypothetical protein
MCQIPVPYLVNLISGAKNMESSNLVVVKEEVAEEEDKAITGYPVLLSISCEKIDPLAR